MRRWQQRATLWSHECSDCHKATQPCYYSNCAVSQFSMHVRWHRWPHRDVVPETISRHKADQISHYGNIATAIMCNLTCMLT